MLKIIDQIPVCGDPIFENAFFQIKNCLKGADRVALCADHHKGYGCPIGGVVASETKISPACVGYDIACGNKAVRLDIRYEDIERDLPKLAERIWSALSFGVGRSNSETLDHELFDDPAWQDVAMLRDTALQDRAHSQLGTIGGGNHYCDVFRDEAGWIWVGVHFGSRGLGHKIAGHFMDMAANGKANQNMDALPDWLVADSDLGQEYLTAMSLAGRYAYAGRDWVCQTVSAVLGGQILEEIHNHHNFAWREKHDGKDFWVVRKGATPAAPGQKGFVGSTMGDSSVILEGVDSPDSAALLYSTVHGAGRVMSRTQAAGKVKWEKGRRVRVAKGEIDMDVVKSDLVRKRIILKGGGADEAPGAYKHLDEVLDQHGSTIKILHRLKPLIVCMAAEEEFDPCKD